MVRRSPLILLAASIALAAASDAAELLTLQRACWVQEQQANPGVHIPPLHEGLADLEAWLGEWTTLVLRSSGRLVGAVRGRLDGETWDIGRLMAPLAPVSSAERRQSICLWRGGRRRVHACASGRT